MLGNKEIMARNILKYMEVKGKTRKDMCKALGVKYTTFTDWVKGNSYPQIDKIELMANYFGINKADLVEEHSASSKTSALRIPVFGSVPAGIPMEAIEDIADYEEIPSSWTSGDREYFALRVTSDSMYPKYIEGDTIILEKCDDAESGTDCVVYVNGYDATLKKVIKKQGCVVLQPLNPDYDPAVYENNREVFPVRIAGRVVEIRRKV